MPDSGVVKLNPETASPNAYQICRPVDFSGERFNVGDLVEFTDPKIEHIFLKNNYIK